MGETSPRVIAPGRRLGHYDLIELIGRGGMGEVYSARDTRLGRDVAVKVLLESSTNDPERLSRFEREAKLLASLNHPNICTVHEIGEHQRTGFIVMEYVAGRPLSELIQQGGLPLDRVVSFGVQIADALAHAHARRVIHRDLKSRNVMVTPEGRLKVLDFGLATIVKATPSTSAMPSTTATTRTTSFTDRPGEITGTVPYMAPEILRGESANQRTDIWGIGIVLYEMATGTLPFRGETVFDLLAAILRDPLPVWTHCNNWALQLVVQRCLMKAPAERYQEAAEVRAALQTLDTHSGRARQTPGGTATPRRRRPDIAEASVAVLPLANLTGDPDQSYFCDGIAEDIITGLTKVPGLHVASRTSAFQFREGASDLRDIRRRLRVNAVLEGSIRRAGDRLRVTATLVSTNNGYQLWSEQFEKDMSDVFAIQDEISKAIVEHLRVQLVRPIDAQLVKSHTDNVEAYRLYLRGRFQFNKRRPELLQSGLDNFEQAIVADPGYALAYAGLADTYTLLAIHGQHSPHAVFPKAMKAAARALELDPNLGAAHASTAFAKATYEWDWEAAEHHFRRAIKLNPGDSNARHWYAIDCLSPLGRLEEALEHLERSVALDPLSVSINTSLGGLLHDRREYSRAIDQYKDTIELEPTFYFSHWNLGRTYEQLQEYELAMAAFQKALTIAPGSPHVLAYIARCQAFMGRKDEARRLLDELIEMRTRRFAHATGPAIVYLSLGEYDRAFEFFEKAYVERSIWLIWLKVAPMFDGFRGDPRYLSLLQRMRLA
jgi:serine/threonine protein kinase/tetratricopeptide (TPR) repeat protein